MALKLDAHLHFSMRSIVEIISVALHSQINVSRNSYSTHLLYLRVTMNLDGLNSVKLLRQK